MSEDGEFTLEMFGITEPEDETEVLLTEADQPIVSEEDISEDELEARLQTATEEEINAYNDDGIIPPLRESANAHLATEPEIEKPAKKERKKREPKVQADGAFQLPGGRHLRPELQKAGLTEVDAIGEIQSNQLQSTEGYLTWREVTEVLVQHGISESAFKKANGGNRALLPPIHPVFRIYWVGQRKYFSAEAVSEESIGLIQQMLAYKPKQQAKPKKERKAKQVEDVPPVVASNETLADLSKATLVQFAKAAVPDISVSKNMSKAQLLTILEEKGLTLKDYLAQS